MSLFLKKLPGDVALAMKCVADTKSNKEIPAAQRKEYEDAFNTLITNMRDQRQTLENIKTTEKYGAKDTKDLLLRVKSDVHRFRSQRKEWEGVCKFYGKA